MRGQIKYVLFQNKLKNKAQLTKEQEKFLQSKKKSSKPREEQKLNSNKNKILSEASLCEMNCKNK